jgi:hypothetical protein
VGAVVGLEDGAAVGMAVGFVGADVGLVVGDGAVKSRDMYPSPGFTALL